MSDLEFWEEKFAGTEYRFGKAPNAFLARQARLLKPGMRALSVADGEGRNGVWLAEQGLDVLAQDFSPSAQAKARTLAKEHGTDLAFEQSDITARIWEPDHYDVVVGIFFQFLKPPNRARVFDGIRRTVKPGGLVLIEGYGEAQMQNNTGGPKIIENLYTENLLREAFAGFAELQIDTYDVEISEGPGHDGMSALVDLVGRR